MARAMKAMVNMTVAQSRFFWKPLLVLYTSLPPPKAEPKAVPLCWKRTVITSNMETIICAVKKVWFILFECHRGDHIGAPDD